MRFGVLGVVGDGSGWGMARDGGWGSKKSKQDQEDLFRINELLTLSSVTTSTAIITFFLLFLLS